MTNGGETTDSAPWGFGTRPVSKSTTSMQEEAEAERSQVRAGLVTAMAPYTKLLNVLQRTEVAERVMEWGVERFEDLAQCSKDDLIRIGLQSITAHRLLEAAKSRQQHVVFAQRSSPKVNPESRDYAAARDVIAKGPLLGGGNFGEVYRGTLNDEPVALKKMKQTGYGEDYTDDSLKREMQLQQEISKLCSQVVIAHCLWRQDGDLYLVMELCDAGSLDAVPQERKTEQWLAEILLSIATALAQLHKAGYSNFVIF